MANEVKTLRVELTGNVDQFARAFAQASKAADGVGRSVAKLQGDVAKSTSGMASAFKGLDSALSGFGISLGALAGVGGATLAITKIGGAIADLAGQAEQWGNIAKSTGLGIDTVQRLSAYLEDAGIPAESLKKAMKALSAEAASGGKNLEQFGVSIKGWELLSQEERLRKMARTIADVEDPATQSALAAAAFGKSGADLIPVMEGVAEGADKMYSALSEGSVAALQQADATIDAFTRKLSDAKKTLLAGAIQIAQGLSFLPGGIPVFVPPVPQVPSGGEKPKGPTDAEKQRQAREAAARAKADNDKAAAKAARDAAKAEAEAKRQAAEQRKLAEDLDAEAAKGREEAQKASIALDEAAAKAEAELAIAELGGNETVAGRIALLREKADAEVVTIANAYTQKAATGAATEADREARDAAIENVNARLQLDEATVRLDASNKEFNEGVKAEAAELKRLEEREREAITTTERLGNAFTGIADIAFALEGAFREIGISAESGLGKAVTAVGKLAEAGEAAVDSFTRFSQGDIFGGIASGVSAVGKAFGAVKGLFRKEEQDVNDLRDAFFEAQGGFVALQQKLVGLTNQDLVKKIFDAKTVKDYNAAVAEVMDLLDTQTQAQQALDDAMQRYGIEATKAGGQIASAALDEQAKQLYQDWSLLSAKQADMVYVGAQMAPNVSDFVNASKAAGQAIPEAMRPMLETMIANGQLLDENGQAYGSLEDAGVSFAKTQTEMWETLIEKIDRFISALTGIPTDQSTTVHVNYDTSGKPSGEGFRAGEVPPGGGDVPQLAAGGIVRMPTLAMVGEAGPEAIIPLDKLLGGGVGGGTTVNVYANVSRNPWQTAEEARTMDAHVLDLLRADLARDLAAAVPAGAA